MRAMQFAEKPSIIVKRPSHGKLGAYPHTNGPRQRLFRAPDPMTSQPPVTPPLVVLDTNVVLDLWLFADPRAAQLRDALQAGHVQALVTEPTLAELVHVLQRPFVQAWGTAADGLLADLRACSKQVTPPPRQAPLPPRCSDDDDQKFVDLAWSWPAAWLLSRDRAVLKLARHARRHGLQIGTPEAWAAAQKPD